MQFAKAENGERVHINDADSNITYFCPTCDAPMTQKKRGKHKAPHFAHQKGYLCSDSWHYEPMSDWHLSFQAQYPMENREVSIINELGRHRADVLINNTVIEFQHSPITDEEFNARNEFYTACGYRVIWLFDVRKIFGSRLTTHNFTQYYWSHPPKMLADFDLFGSVQVYFHLLDETQQKGGCIIRLIDMIAGDLSHFVSHPSERYTEANFVKMTMDALIRQPIDTKVKEKLYHSLYILTRTNGKQECFGCPINEGGYAPLKQEYGRTSCANCTYCVGKHLETQTIRCAGYYRDHLTNIKNVTDIRKFTYIAHDGAIHRPKINAPSCPAATIAELDKAYNATELIVRNIYNQDRYRIEESHLDYYRLTGRTCHGFWRPHHANALTEFFDIIKNANKPEWLVDAFVPKKT